MIVNDNKLNKNSIILFSKKKVNKLIPRLERMKKFYPLMSKFLRKILDIYLNSFIFLEDWIIDVLYYDVYTNRFMEDHAKTFTYIEEKLRIISEYNSQEYNELVNEIIKRIKSENCHAMAEKIWDNIAEIIKLGDLIKEGHKINLYPTTKSENKKADIISKCNNDIHITECKFLRKSSKLEVLLRKLERCINLKKNLSNKFLNVFEISIVTPNVNIKELKQEHINAVKKFIIKCVKKPKKEIEETFTDEKEIEYKFKYPRRLLGVNLNENEIGLEFLAENFFNRALNRKIDDAKKQLDETIKYESNINEYDTIKKNIFLIVDSDEEYISTEFFGLGKSKIELTLERKKIELEKENINLEYKIVDIA